MLKLLFEFPAPAKAALAVFIASTFCPRDPLYDSDLHSNSCRYGEPPKYNAAV
jgi:hypothetical protein